MLKRFRKTKQEENVEQLPDALEEEVDFEPMVETLSIETPDVEKPTTLDSLSDDEILAMAAKIQARIGAAEEKKHQEAIEAEQSQRYAFYAQQEDRITKGRQEQAWNFVNVGMNANTPSIMNILDEIFGDSISKEMKGVLGMLVRAANKQEQQINPNNVSLLRDLIDYMNEFHNRNK